MIVLIIYRDLSRQRLCSDQLARLENQQDEQVTRQAEDKELIDPGRHNNLCRRCLNGKG